jgi:hypothetical protein
VIRILIRQVIDSRHRAPKSLGIADSEAATDLPLFTGQEVSDLSVRIYHPPPNDERVRFETRVPVARGATPDYWEVLRDALNRVLPPGRGKREEACRGMAGAR